MEARAGMMMVMMVSASNPMILRLLLLQLMPRSLVTSTASSLDIMLHSGSICALSIHQRGLHIIVRKRAPEVVTARQHQDMSDTESFCVIRGDLPRVLSLNHSSFLKAVNKTPVWSLETTLTSRKSFQNSRSRKPTST